MTNATDGGGKPLPMTVDKVSFLLDRLGQDCSPLQYLRELTQNAIEAICARACPVKSHGMSIGHPMIWEKAPRPR